MKRKTMSVILHILLIIVAILLGLFFFWFLPFYGNELAREESEFAFAYVPCLIWAYAFATPIFIALYPAWKIISSIEIQGGAFCEDNVKNFKLISILAFIDAFIFPTGMFILASLGAGSAPLTLVFTPMVILACVIVGFICYVISRLVKDAVIIKEENELTV